MKVLIFVATLLLSLTAFAQGTMSTDDTAASQGDASLSGTTNEEIDLREEEVQMQEEKFDPSYDNEPIEIEMEQERMEQTEDEVSY